MKDSELRHKRAGLKRGNAVPKTSRGRHIHKPAPNPPSHKELEAVRARLRGSLLRYDDPLNPVLD